MVSFHSTLKTQSDVTPFMTTLCSWLGVQSYFDARIKKKLEGLEWVEKEGGRWRGGKR